MITRRQALQYVGAAGFVPRLLGRARAASAGSTLPALAPKPWKPLFDGRSLTGWKPSPQSPHSKASKNTTAGHWRVEDGLIVGSQDTPNNGGLLLTEAEFGDVEIALETRNDFGMDSGIFARCTLDGRAYQCLIDYYEGGTIGGVLGERIWNVRGVRNYSFGAAPDIITLNDNFQRCPVLPEAWPFFLAGRGVERRADADRGRPADDHHLGQWRADPSTCRTEVRPPRARPHRPANPRWREIQGDCPLP